MAVTIRGFAAPALRILTLGAMLCVSADARRLDPHLGAAHSHDESLRQVFSSVSYEGPAYDGCCDGVNGVVLDCCRVGGCCHGTGYKGEDETFLDCCVTTGGDSESNRAVSRVISTGPEFDGCCDVRDETLMDCCTQGGCCPDDGGVSLDCCVGGGGEYVEAQLGQAQGVRQEVDETEFGLGKKHSDEKHLEKKHVRSSANDDDNETTSMSKKSTHPSVTHPVSPEIAFAPAEEADADDPTYGRFATLDPGGAGYYEKVNEGEDFEDDESFDDVVSAQDLIAVVANANDDSVDPVESGEVTVASQLIESEKGSKASKLHTKRWWERYSARHGSLSGDAGVKTSLQTFLLQSASVVCVVVWLTALVVSAVLKRTDGRGEDDERTGLL